MSDERFDEETLMAYADGELGPAQAAAVEAAMARDPAIARTVRLFRDTAVAAQSAVKAETPPVPDALRAAVEAAIARAGAGAPPSPADLPVAAPVVIAPFRPAANNPSYAIAASAAIIAIAVGAYFAGAHRGELPPGPGLAVVSPGAESVVFQEALSRTPAGNTRPLQADSSVALNATFRDGGGRLCREFRVERAGADAVAGVACRTAGAWSVAFAVVQPGSGDSFTPAAGNALLEAFLVERGASPPLGAEEEADALRGADSPR
jgi:anti-sigma factor RsiW